MTTEARSGVSQPIIQPYASLTFEFHSFIYKKIISVLFKSELVLYGKHIVMMNLYIYI